MNTTDTSPTPANIIASRPIQGTDNGLIANILSKQKIQKLDFFIGDHLQKVVSSGHFGALFIFLPLEYIPTTVIK